MIRHLDPGGFVRAVFGSSSNAAARLREADQTLRTAMPISRRISFVAAAGGCGTTSVVAAVGALLAGRRAGMVLAADAAGGRAGLLGRVGIDSDALRPAAGGTAGTASGADDGASRQAELRRRGARRAADARAGLPRGAGGIYLLDLAAAPDRSQASIGDWAGQVGPISRFYDLVLTDWGVRSAGVAAASVDVVEIVALSHVMVVIGRADPAGVRAAADLVQAATASQGRRTPADGATRVLMVLNDVAGTVGSPIGVGDLLGVDVRRVPFDRALGRNPTLSLAALRSSTRIAQLELAAALVTAARPHPSGVRP